MVIALWYNEAELKTRIQLRFSSKELPTDLLRVCHVHDLNRILSGQTVALFFFFAKIPYLLIYFEEIRYTGIF